MENTADIPECKCAFYGYCAVFEQTMPEKLWKLCQSDPKWRRHWHKTGGPMGKKRIKHPDKKAIELSKQAMISPEVALSVQGRIPVECIYFGEATGETVECKTCQGNVKAKLFQCSHPERITNPTTTVTHCMRECNLRPKKQE